MTSHQHSPSVDALRSSWEHALRAAGKRVTKQRLAVLGAVHTHPHGTADELHRSAAQELPELALPTTHGIVNDLTEAGLLRRIDVPHSPSLYETDLGDNHHHAQCVSCGRLEDVACAVGHAPCLTPSDSHGMRILVADVLYRGLCEQCAAGETEPSLTHREKEESPHG
ncbi:Fur family transcriptional regulator [Galactobacter valiniphilus]|uniref:Fur family transcriptional regulator n=1 Tax=Galactobacter valiniphilus TaxID=2676122 RepID=UPI003736A9F0